MPVQKKLPALAAGAPAPRRRRRSAKQQVPAPRRRTRRRRSGSGQMLSANSPMQALLMQGAMAVVGGVAGKVIRNAMPEATSPEIKAAVVVGAGVAVGMAAKAPMVAAGMIGSAGAYYASSLGNKYNIKLLSDSGRAQYVRLAENSKPAVRYVDEAGRPLTRRGDSFYTQEGYLTGYQPNNFK